MNSWKPIICISSPPIHPWTCIRGPRRVPWYISIGKCVSLTIQGQPELATWRWHALKSNRGPLWENRRKTSHWKPMRHLEAPLPRKKNFSTFFHLFSSSFSSRPSYIFASLPRNRPKVRILFVFFPSPLTRRRAVGRFIFQLAGWFRWMRFTKHGRGSMYQREIDN